MSSGYFDLSDWGHVEISGPDATDFLNRMSTVALKEMTLQKMSHGALLTGKGHVIALGFLQKVNADTYQWVLSPGQSSTACEHLEKFHFQEQITISDMTPHAGLFGLWNPTNFEDRKPLEIFNLGNGYSWRDDLREKLYWLKTPTKALPPAVESLACLEKSLWEYWRIEKGIPEVNKEISENEIILETNFDRAVARNKGCYPGQEVVERIFTYGSVNRKLLPVELPTSDFRLPEPLTSQKVVAGNLVSLVPVPDKPNRSIGLAYIHRNFWEIPEFLTQSGVRVSRRQIT